jgi:anti-sigma B factor antagonist
MAPKVGQIGDVTVITVPGPRLDASQSTTFKRDVSPLLAGSSKVIFDMNGLEFMDSTGLGAIVSCLKVMNASGGDLKLCHMSKQIRALFELVRMHRVFDIYNTREEAVGAFQL